MVEFSIASWNVHMGLHNDFAKARDTVNRGALNDVVARCVEIDADVLVLQEAWWWGDASSNLIHQVAEAIGGTAHSYVSPTPVPRYQASWAVAVISRLASTRLDDVAIESVKKRQRAIVRVRLDEAGVTVAGCHLDGIHSLRTRPDLWLRQVRQFRSIADRNDIVVGDMNMWGPVVERNAGRLQRAVHGKTWPAVRPHSQIDHLLIDPERISVTSSEVMPNFDSDHLPIRAVLRTHA